MAIPNLATGLCPNCFKIDNRHSTAGTNITLVTALDLAKEKNFFSSFKDPSCFIISTIVVHIFSPMYIDINIENASMMLEVRGLKPSQGFSYFALTSLPDKMPE